MNIILSIHPKWAKLIYEGKKTIEWRKTLPRKMDLKLLRDGSPNSWYHQMMRKVRPMQGEHTLYLMGGCIKVNMGRAA